MINKVARKTAKGQKIQIVRLTSLTYLKRQITKAKKSQLQIWYKQKIKKQDSQKYRFYSVI